MTSIGVLISGKLAEKEREIACILPLLMTHLTPECWRTIPLPSRPITKSEVDAMVDLSAIPPTQVRFATFIIGQYLLRKWQLSMLEKVMDQQMKDICYLCDEVNEVLQLVSPVSTPHDEITPSEHALATFP